MTKNRVRYQVVLDGIESTIMAVSPGAPFYGNGEDDRQYATFAEAKRVLVQDMQENRNDAAAALRRVKNLRATDLGRGK